MVMCPIPLYKILTLECTGDINNNVINMISEKCEVLEKLSLINIQGISPNSLVIASEFKNIERPRGKNLFAGYQCSKRIFKFLCSIVSFQLLLKIFYEKFNQNIVSSNFTSLFLAVILLITSLEGAAHYKGI